MECEAWKSRKTIDVRLITQIGKMGYSIYSGTLKPKSLELLRLKGLKCSRIKLHLMHLIEENVNVYEPPPCWMACGHSWIFCFLLVRLCAVRCGRCNGGDSTPFRLTNAASFLIEALFQNKSEGHDVYIHVRTPHSLFSFLLNPRFQIFYV